jgi:hypothetical protein
LHGKQHSVCGSRDDLNPAWEDGFVMVGPVRDEALPLLGRAQEQNLLTSLLDDVATRGQALILRGEPGIGKSRLLSETERRARERGMAVLTTTGVQSEAHLPFAGLHQMLRPVRGRASELRDVQRAALDAAFGLSDEDAPEPFRIAMAALDLLSDVATGDGLLLVVEDAQWLDRPTSDVLAFVARRIESDPIVFVAAIREGYASPLVEANLPEHDVARLDETAAAALLEDIGIAVARLGEDAGDLAPIQHHVVRPLDLRRQAERGLDRIGDRDAGDERELRRRAIRRRA